MTRVAERITDVHERIARACEKAGRASKDVTLIAVTKGVKKDDILSAKDAGIQIFAENRIQEALTKIAQVPGQWHLIGHLQSNKAKTAAEIFGVIQSVDSVKIAKTLNDEAAALGKTLEVFLEINISGEPQKHGFGPEEIYGATDEIKEFEHLKVTGLMGIAPNTPDLELRRASFRKLKGLFGVCRSLKSENFEIKHLSMGMSDDFEIAIEEGATILRLGRAIFGEREA